MKGDINEISELKEKTRLKNLENPSGKIKIVIDTDTYNEVDDQFAVTYALKSSKKLNVEAIYAAPFDNDRSENPHDGMKKSYQEILRVLDKANLSNNEMVFKGSNAFLQNYNAPLESPAAQDLVERALKAEKKLYVVALRAITNISSAILMESDIIKK